VSRRLLVAPYPSTELATLDGSGYASAVASIGYEPRSIVIARALKGTCRGSAVEFAHGHVLSYDENRRGYAELGWEAVSCEEDQFLQWVRELFARIAGGELRDPRQRRPRVAIDVSSMTRTRIAALVQALAELPPHLQLGADFLYVPAVYRDPETPPPAILHRAPVAPYFAGSLVMDDSTVVLGLGYEQHKAASTIEDFGPSEVVAFVPEGPDERFLQAVIAANSGVLQGPLTPREERYPVGDPFATFQRLEALCFDLLYREHPRMPVLVPLGPKIFAACCLVVGALHPEHVAVWRVSYRTQEPASPAEASSQVFGLRVDVPLFSES
jgi:hypothetical protein